MSSRLAPIKHIKITRSWANKLQVRAYGHLIVRVASGNYFMIVHPSILCCIKFKTLKDAILSAKVNAHLLPCGYTEIINGAKYFRLPKLTKIEA